ncbi:hypothetical protein M885DRAFT_623519 [Pelagophyceae sp. CCMP2097]|nr:hypothetical protein M885DRAFT_623519 [Pelagophyceae sp. CCMP2097]
MAVWDDDRWYRGVVKNINPDGCFAIHFGDGDQRSGVLADKVHRVAAGDDVPQTATRSTSTPAAPTPAAPAPAAATCAALACAALTRAAPTPVVMCAAQSSTAAHAASASRAFSVGGAPAKTAAGGELERI